MSVTRRAARRLFYASLFATLGITMSGWWLGNAHQLAAPGGRLIALGRLFGLLATYTVLLEVLLVSRLPYFEEQFDLQELLDLHRWNGYGLLLSISAHLTFLTLGYAGPGHVGLWHQFVLLNTQLEDVLNATLGTLVFFGAALLSVRVARKRLPYELWFATHLGVYGGILLVALHQLKNGGDFSRHFWFTAWWYMGYIGVFGLLGWYRFLRPVVQAWRHQFHVAKVVTEAHNTYSIHIAGRHLPGFRFQPGQYATWWMLAPGKWWQGHPFSFSSAPGADTLRLTIKASGNFTHTIGKLRPGTRIIIDGPRGSFTASRAVHAEHVLLVAGGIGITPYIAMIKQLLQSGKPVTLLYAARARQDVAFGRELAALQRKGLQLHLFLSKENQRLDATALQPFVQPGLVAYICGPDAMSASVHKQLRRLGVPDRAIITERFSF